MVYWPGNKDKAATMLATTTKYGRRLVLGLLVLVGGGVGLCLSLTIGGMGLALMGTAIGIGPVGWIGLGIVAVLAIFGLGAAVYFTYKELTK